ncbi:MAG: hypothetical protein Q7U47_05600 [Paludibacter sp.]|nr:hypothetical protein [Paludibacter sp.]
MRLKNNSISIVITCTVLFASCVSTSTLKQTISRKISGNINQVELFNTTYLKLNADSLLSTNNEVMVRKKSSYIIPLVVYWGWKRSVECNLTNRYFVNLFSDILKNKNADFPYKKLFGDKILLLELTSVPSAFNLINKGSYFLFPNIHGLEVKYY